MMNWFGAIMLVVSMGGEQGVQLHSRRLAYNVELQT